MDYFQLASISLPHSCKLADVNIMTQRATDTLGASVKYINYYDNYNNSILLLNYQDAETQLKIANSFGKFLKSLNPKFDPEVKIAVTPPTQALANYKELSEKLQQILTYKIQYPPYRLMLDDGSDKSGDTIDKETVSHLSKCFFTKDFSSINSFIDGYFILKPIDYATLKEPKRIYNIIIQKINELFDTHALYHTELYTRAYESFDSFTSLRMYIKSALFEVQRLLNDTDKTTSSIIESSIAYIDEHISEDLTMPRSAITCH